MNKLLQLYKEKDGFVFHCSYNIWGDEVLIMEKNGKAFARAYWYHDDKEVIYLDMLNVSSESRKKGIATELQEIRENIGRIIGMSTAMLYVVKDSWMHSWYIRRGYVYDIDHCPEENTIWMKKSLIQK